MIHVRFLPVEVLCTPVVAGRLEEVDEEDLLSEVKVTVARSFPDQESLRWGDGSIVHEDMDHLHLSQRRGQQVFLLPSLLHRNLQNLILLHRLISLQSHSCPTERCLTPLYESSGDLL